MNAPYRPLLAFAVLSSGIALAQQTAPPPAPNGLSAREVFYEAEQIASQPAQPAAPAKPEQKPAVHVEPHKKHVKSPSSVAVVHPPKDTKGTTVAPATPNAPASEGPALTNASLATTRYPPLGLRYSVYRLVDGRREPVSADTVFHSNDHIQFVVEVNTPAYLYVISRGASGRWTTLFPGSDAPPSANVIQPNHPWVFPPNEMITFTEPAGKEELFLFLSRQPITNSEELMLQMSGANGSAPGAQPQAPGAGPHATVIEAFNRMDDSQFQALQTAYSRDLIVEKVDSGSPSAAPAQPAPDASSAAAPPAQDNSVYVVNPSGSADSHVVATVVFHHE